MHSRDDAPMTTADSLLAASAASGSVTTAAAAIANVAALPVMQRPSLDAVWEALRAVPDPEIPVVSVVELGIVRAVQWNDVVNRPVNRAGNHEGNDAGNDAAHATLSVRVTPTYSGCPATELIMQGIREALAAIGVGDLKLEIQLSPPWTTGWISAAGRAKLREFGIAPPAGDRALMAAARIDVRGISPLRRVSVVVPCPRCGSTSTVLVSQFGSTACKAQYRCDDCREPFDYFKPH